MHNSRKVFLLSEEPRCILASYEAHEGAEQKEFKTYDSTIKKGDFVVVPTNTRHNMTVMKVEAVDVEPDLESHAKMDWVISVVDTGAYAKNVELEEQFIERVNSAEKRRKKEALREAVFADMQAEKLALGHTET